jgi:hypothetical protein
LAASSFYTIISNDHDTLNIVVQVQTPCLIHMYI